MTRRKSAIEVQIERMNKFLDVIHQRNEIGDFDLQKVLGLGSGIHERISKIIKTEYCDEVKWIKRTRTWKSIPLDPTRSISEQVTKKSLA